LKSNTSIEGLFLKGVNANFSIERMRPFLQEGRWMSFQNASVEMVISGYTARILQLKVGDKAFIYFMSKDGSASRVRPVTVCGIYKTAIEEYDRSFAWIPLSFLQKISGGDSLSISGYEVSLHDQGKEAQVAGALMDALPVSWFATPLDQLYPNLFDWLNLQDVNRRMIIIIMCIVAIINLVSCLLILVLERSKMIGLLKAVGATDLQVQGVFWRQGVRIGFKGVLWGNLLGLAIAFIQQATGFIRLDESAYYIREAPVKLIWWQIVWVDMVTLIVCFLVLLLPSLLVRRIRPVEALRFD
jgi:lipoprotein-releasing system permease protein